jgi:non-ribosomal peptide synthetase component F
MSVLLQDLVTAQAERVPQAPAVIAHADAITYADLERRSNQVARVLREHGCRRGDRVCVLAPTTPDAIAAMLGIFKADAIYVPLDPAASPDRVAAAARACQPVCLLTAASRATAVDELVRAGAIGRPTVVGSLERSPIAGQSFFTEFCMADVTGVSDRAVASRNRPTNPAYVVFSGPGVPRGVVTTHASLARAVSWAATHFDVRSEDRHAVMSPLARDRSVYETVGALAAGAVVLPAALDVVAQPRRLADFIRRERLTHWGATADDLAAMADADVVAPGDFPALRHVITWGVGPAAFALRYWMRRVGHARFTTLYGAPEATSASAYYTWAPDAEPAATLAPVGTPCPGQEVLVLNGRLEPAATDETGDLWIRGVGVSPGYWGDATATAEVFHQARAGASHDRMYRTGDRGLRGPDGQIRRLVPPARGNWPVAAPSPDSGAAIESGAGA